ncbi:MAG: excalibur calcium-binding domain-containing protein [Pseudonocardia sp.]|nr:excalibur calcium-binding domain-containing protein [Pseudonocardia sp.]
MSARALLAAPAAATLLLGLLASGAALAAEPTGPDTAGCKAATQHVSSLEAQVSAFTAGPPGTLSLDALQKAVDGAVAADNATDPPLTADSAATTAAKEALAARTGQIASLKADLTAAQSDEKTACTAPVVDPPQGDDQTADDQDQAGDLNADDPAVTPADPTYETCAEAVDAGVIMPATEGRDPGYQADLDRDKDGVACEATEGPAPTDPADPVVLTPQEAKDAIAGFTCTGGPDAAFGRLQDQYTALVDGLPSDTSNQAFGEVNDAYNLKLSAVNFCFPKGTTPPPAVTAAAGNSGSGSFSQLDSVPSKAAETGGGPA